MRLDGHVERIAEGCKRFNIRALYLIGSAARGDDHEDSDLDFVVSFNDLNQPGIADRYFEFHSFLETELDSHVDLIEESAIKNPYFKRSIDRDKKLIYG